eukprot:TRINITY_DN79294_c0_g1_i1.p1 TRINITY_DN79294_c0_g1~~TRINITY_DN79294_c0_g1_i1.p1  ORF type:complete len:364 (-),score=51.89 TRINITY_DN79294_c0_g1_i1:155-1246(-)
MASRALLQCSRLPRLNRFAGRRDVTSLPQIPGHIFTNSEIADDRLVGQVRRWAASCDTLQDSGNGFDLLQIAETVDGRPMPRAICGLLRTRLQLAEGDEPIKAMVALFYRARDYLNREFWEDQIRRLCDIVAEEYLTSGRGVQLMVHHAAPTWPLGLEIGNHRLLSDLDSLTFFGRALHRPQLDADLVEGHEEFLTGEEAALLDQQQHRFFHRLDRPTGTQVENIVSGDVRRGDYVLRSTDGEAVCGLRVLGVQPWRLVCGGAWAAEGRASALAHLAERLRRRARTSGCCVVADSRDERFEKLFKHGNGAQHFGLWRRRRRMAIAVTGVPSGFSPEEQARLAGAPFLVPWEFLPFHGGRVVLI